MVDQVKDKVGDLADQHGGKVSDAVNQATDFIDDKTGGKLTPVTDKGRRGDQDGRQLATVAE